MKLTLSLFALFAITLGSTAQLTKTTPGQTKAATAVAYNDFMVAEQIKIGKTIKEFNTVFSNSSDTNEIHEARKAIVKQADSSVRQLKMLATFSGDTSLKKNAILLFSFYAKTAANEYKQLVQVAYNKKKTSAEIEKEMGEIVKIIVDKEKIYDTGFMDAQKAFAEKHHIKLSENEFKVDQ